MRAKHHESGVQKTLDSRAENGVAVGHATSGDAMQTIDAQTIALYSHTFLADVFPYLKQLHPSAAKMAPW
jgi:hypothetical protein